MKTRQIFKICKGQYSITGVALVFTSKRAAKRYLKRMY